MKTHQQHSVVAPGLDLFYAGNHFCHLGFKDGFPQNNWLKAYEIKPLKTATR